MKAVLIFLLVPVFLKLGALKCEGDPTSVANAQVDSIELEDQLQLARKIALFNPDSAQPMYRKLLAQTDERHMRIRYITYGGIAEIHLIRFQSDSALICAELLLKESEQTQYYKGISHAYILRGIVHMQLGNGSNALEDLSKAEEIALQMKDTVLLSQIAVNMVAPNLNMGHEQAALDAAKRGYDLFKKTGIRNAIAQAASSLASLHKRRGEVDQAIELTLEALEVFEETDDQTSIATCYYSLGNIYKDIHLFDKAMEYLLRSAKIRESLELKNYLATSYSGISEVYRDMNQLERALEFALKSLKLDREMNRESRLGFSLGLVGAIYLDMQKVPEAIDHLEEGIMHQRKVGENRLMAGQLANLSKAYYETQDYSAAMKYAKEALALAQSLEGDPEAYSALQTLHKCYAAQAMFEQAYQTSVEMSALKDSLTSAEEKKAVFRKVYEYEYEKKALADSLAASQEKLVLELAHQEELNETTRTRNYLLGAGALLLILAGGGWSRVNLIRKANKRLKEARDRAEESEQFKQRFLANMSHEIRTPMNAVLGMSQLALDTDLNAKQRSYLDAIKNSSETLLVIVNDILDFSKLEQGKLTIEHIPFSVREQLKIVHQTLQYKAEEKGLLFDTEIDDHLPEMVMGDPARFSQVMMNLVANAIKFTEKGGVHIEVKRLSNNRIKFSVKDSGIGIPKDRQAQLFNSFEQGDNSTSRKYGGSGLGLAITKDLVELQGGSISIESAEREGSVFSFDLELLPAEPQVETFNVNSDPDALSGIKLLVAEDNKYNQIVIVDTLENLIDGVEITLVENGVEALEALGKEQFDAILMDAHMPVMDGIEATKKIRAQENQVPIIALTASVMNEEVENCLAAGMNDSLPKPFKREDLLNALGKHYSVTPKLG